MLGRYAMDAKRLPAIGALVLFCAATMPVALAAPQGFEPEATVRRTDRLALISLTRAGDRLVAAGERGRILVSRDAGATWQVAKTPTYNTLTSLAFMDANIGFATGHQGVLLRTADGGESWAQATLGGKEKPALFAVRMDGTRGIAVGAYGAYYESSDGGITWAPRRVLDADFDRHLTGIASCGERCLVIAGEAGTILRSDDAGATWKRVDSPYEGSFFGAAGLPDGTAIAFGMRGNAFRSTDRGLTWQRIDLGNYKGALQGATLDGNGSLVLTGADGFVATSVDAGRTFATGALPGRPTISALLVIDGRVLTAGPSGLRWAQPAP
jgi:photosystem II stability/assembly factor-like uncharacterized protein